MADKTLPQLLKDAQKQRSVNKTAAARMLGVTRTTVRAWERGAQEPGLKHAPRIVEFTQEEPEIVFRAMGLTDDDIEVLLGHPVGGYVAALSQPIPVAA